MSESANERRLDPLVRIVRQRQDDPISIRDLAKRLRMKQRDVLTACEDNDFCINVGVGIQGVGYAEHERIGDYTIEDLSFDANAGAVPRRNDVGTSPLLDISGSQQ